MAIQNDSRLYSGGSAVLNLLPHTQLYANLVQRQAARKDAFDEYIRNLGKGINSAGLRNSDRPAFDKMMNDWQQFGMQHGDEIRRRQHGADIAFMNKYQDLQNLVAESKGEEEKKKPLVEAFLDPNKRDRLDSDAMMGQIHSHDEPILIQDETGGLARNPNRKSIDLTSVAFEPKPFEQDKYFKQFEDVKRTDLPPTIVKNPKDLTQTVTTTSIFDKDAKDLIATRAVSDYMNNKSFKGFIDKLNPQDYNDYYKQNFGHDIQNPGDLAAAYTLKGMQQKTVKQEMKDDILAREKAMAALNHSYRLGEIAYRDKLKQMSDDDADTWIDQHIQELKDQALKDNVRRVVNSVNGKEVKGVKVPLDPTLNSILGYDKKYGELMLGDDGKFYSLPYQVDNKGPIKDESGKGFKVDQTSISQFGDNALKLALGKKTAGTKQTNVEMETGKKTAKPTYTKIEEQAISNFMKANNLGREKAIEVLTSTGRLK